MVSGPAQQPPPQEVLGAVEAALVEHFGQQPARASVAFLGVEPIEVLRFEPIPGERAYVSLGMARRPMTPADASVTAVDGPRAELFLHLTDPADQFAGVWRQLAVLAAAPAVEGVVYRPDMTVDLSGPLVAGSRCTGALVAASPIGEIAVGGLSPVAVLQLLPATQAELAWARVRGGAALRQRWEDEGTDLRDLGRSGVALV